MEYVEGKTDDFCAAKIINIIPKVFHIIHICFYTPTVEKATPNYPCGYLWTSFFFFHTPAWRKKSLRIKDFPQFSTKNRSTNTTTKPYNIFFSARVALCTTLADRKE